MNADYDAVTIVQRELEPGENFLWAGRPNPMRAMVPALPITLFAIPWTGFAIFWVASAASMGSHMHGPGPFRFFPLFGVPFILVGLGMLLSPVWAYRKATRTVYGITGRRILMIQAGASRTVQSYTGADLGDIRRTERADGSGDLIFAQQVGYAGSSDWQSSSRSRTTPVGFYGIPNVKEVDRLLRETFKTE